MKTLRSLTSLFIAFFFLTACEDKVDIDVPEGEEKLVVDGIFTNDPSSVITLSKTAPYFNEGHTPRVSDATVMITSNTNDTIQLTEIAESPGDYRSSQAGEIGKIYTLHIRLQNGDTYTSISEKMSRVPEIDSIYSAYSDDVDDPFVEEGYLVYIETLEPKGKGDFYRWTYSINLQEQRGPEDLSFASDELVDGNYVTEAEIASELQANDFVRVTQLSISERAYNYLVAVSQALQVGGPFDSPPSPIKGNVKNDNPGKPDALGYFMVSGATHAEIVVRP